MKHRDIRTDIAENITVTIERVKTELPDKVIDFQQEKKKRKGTTDSFQDRDLEAQNLVMQAWDSTLKVERIMLARKALRLSEECADAYILLGLNDSKNIEEEKEYYEKALDAAKRYIGIENFRAMEGHFWAFIETRPYMRAKFALADALWRLNEKEYAIAHLKDMIRLNPDDHQGVRYILINWLLEAKDFRYLEFIFDEFKEDITAEMKYSELLYLFIKGDHESAGEKFKEAFKANPYIPEYITGKKKISTKEPILITIGDDSEALNYVQNSMYLWKHTRGARKWMENAMKKLKTESLNSNI